MSKLSSLTKFLDRLDEEDFHYTLQSVTEDAVIVAVRAGDERWEFEFSGNGDIEVEVFKSDGELGDEDLIDELFERHAGD
ncbi:MAG: hypothetical protein GTN89_15155 [Acidobacteria bacterium]|nr:hypothetical protein [Acidobacteriota bacterium]NIM61547.1 hypothetical protein [Acidobacteriota bacterium]NIO60558.1 hypothetical protein [Acidobacteriota bacterium]NIQ31665.1 hypothetical protein [Acidobacteriota bacterium]NIQ86904.1 hypothetical protein [Acidobacteriota bacterium]